MNVSQKKGVASRPKAKAVTSAYMNSLQVVLLIWYSLVVSLASYACVRCLPMLDLGKMTSYAHSSRDW